MNQDFLDQNRILWNQKTQAHLDSEFYDLRSFMSGKSSLQDIELELIGEPNNLELLHLQCHFGQDSLSLARMGAKVTGLDLSDKAIEAARQLNEELGLDAIFYQGNVLEADKILPPGKQYDLIFSSYGVIGWLPELKTWGRLIGQLLKPGGRFILVEFHPALWMMDDNFEYLAYSYFNKAAIIETVTGTYADREAAIGGKAYSWNHSLSETLMSLINEGGLQLLRFDEYDYSPYNCFKRTVPHPNGFQIEGLEGVLPMVFGLEAQKG